MKKVILLFLITAVMFSCKKNETTKPDVQKQAEISLNITTILPDAGRDWVPSDDVPACSPDAIPAYAKLIIRNGNELGEPLNGGENGPNSGLDGKYYKVPVFYTNGHLYTQAFKMDVDCYIDDNQTPDNPDDDFEVCCTEYTITEFYLYDASGTIIKAAPFAGPFQQFVENTLPITFNVCDFEKIEVPIDVLCFIPDVYDLFGFFWFEITEITVRELCFFGDICVDYWQYPMTYWENSLYYDQANHIQADMPAIFLLELSKKDANGNYQTIRSWCNEYYDWPETTQPWFGENDPLCIRYADYDNVEDHFRLDLYIYGPWGGTFGYTATSQMFWTWTDGDVSAIDWRPDGVVEFAWGDCVQDPEWLLPYNPPGK